MLNMNKLKGKIAENCMTVAELSKILGINPSTFYRKMKKNSFEIAEADILVQTLKLSKEEACSIFFSQTVA